MDVRCRIEMFGGLRVWQADTLHTRFRTQKAASLLAYLALHLHQSQPRERLVELFWSDRPTEIGRDNLSTALAQLRRQLEPVGVAAGSIFQADRQQVWLNPEGVTTDLDTFDRCIHEAAHSEQATRKAEWLQQAIALYRGDLLPSHYEEWALQEQSRCQQTYQRSLLQMGRLEEEGGHYEAALVLAQRALQTDPYLEEAYQAQMRLYVRLKRPATALQVYEEVQQRFQKELGALPSMRTRRMAEQIRQDPNASLMLPESSLPDQTLPKTALSPAPRMASAVASPPPVASAPPQPSLPPPSLPLLLTRFFGRQQELTRLQQMLQEPGARLVTLLGPGGAGKTRLSLEVAHRLAPLLQERAWFISLAELPHANLLPSALLRALRVSPQPQTDPLDQVASALGTQPCLLVLDNFEHLLEEAGEEKYEMPKRTGAALVRLLLERVPHLRCLVTSRQALRLEGEQEFVLPPLALPQEEKSASPETLIANESVALYVDRARLARPDFTLAASNAEAVGSLCRKLEGMPLALEMAAAWAKTLPPGKMLERLERQLDLLVSRRTDLPARHQSLRATIEWSYDLLTSELREAFARLSVFRGGWSLEAAEALLGKQALDLLAELQERSLILMEEHGEEPRYRMLETLRQFGAEKLEESGQARVTRQRHSDYFAPWAETVGKNIDRPDQLYAMKRLELEYDNLLQVLMWSQQEPEQAETGLGLCTVLAKFWHACGHLTEGRFWCDRMLNAPGTEAHTKTRATVLVYTGFQAQTQGDYASARMAGEEGLEIFREIGDRPGMGMGLQLLGRVYHVLGDIALARARYEEALALQREAGQPLGIGNALNALGALQAEQGDLVAAHVSFEEALAIFSKVEARSEVASSLNNLGTMARLQGDYTLARSRLEEALAISREVGHRVFEAYSLNNLGQIVGIQGDYAAAQDYLEQSLTLHREAGERQRCASIMNKLGDLARTQGDYTQARHCYEEALALSREIGMRAMEAWASHNLGELACEEGDYTAAGDWYARCLLIYRTLDQPPYLASVLESLAALAATMAHSAKQGAMAIETPVTTGDLLRRAARLWGAAEAIREQIRAALEPTKRQKQEGEIAAARAHMGETEWNAAWYEGRYMTRQQVFHYLLDDCRDREGIVSF